MKLLQSTASRKIAFPFAAARDDGPANKLMPTFSGHLALRAQKRDDGRTILAEQSFCAPFHLSKPYWDTDTRTLLVQVVNPTAGILEGDRLESDIAVSEGAALMVTTPSASRIFKMREGTAEGVQRYTVEAGGWLEILPEPLVPHRDCSYTQTTTIDVKAGGELFFADLLMSGRVAHGEAWIWRRLCLTIDVRVGGELILHERLDQSGSELHSLAQLAKAGEAACFGNVVLVAAERAGDEVWRDAVISLHNPELWVGLSRLRAGGWSIKLIARDGICLREGFKKLRAILAQRFPHLACDARKL